MAIGHRPERRTGRAVQHGGDGHAPGRAAQRRRGAARRGEPRDVRRPLAGRARPTRCRSRRSPTACTRDLGRRPRSTRCSPTPRRRATGSGPIPASTGRPSHAIDDGELWKARTRPRRTAWSTSAGRGLRSSGLARGLSPSELAWTDAALDPGALTICFARRFATYKRATLLLSQPERLRRLLAGSTSDRCSSCSPARPTRPTTRGKELIRQIVGSPTTRRCASRFVLHRRLRHALARALVQRRRRLAEHPAPPAGGVRAPVGHEGRR